MIISSLHFTAHTHTHLNLLRVEIRSHTPLANTVYTLATCVRVCVDVLLAVAGGVALVVVGD